MNRLGLITTSSILDKDAILEVQRVTEQLEAPMMSEEAPLGLLHLLMSNEASIGGFHMDSSQYWRLKT